MVKYESSLKNIIEKKTLKWIFVGGKGGVGKTTCSCSLAVQLAKTRKNVLLISTDPAHNISDAFNCKFTKQPTKVLGFSNLFAMEIDGSEGGESFLNMTSSFTTQNEDLYSISKNLISEIAGGLPGIDEATSFSQMIKLIQSMDFEIVIFDTAPTGHTLRLLELPTLIEKSLGKLISLKSQFMPFLSQFSSMFGIKDFSIDQASSKLEETLELVKKINQQFKDSNLTTFVCVCIPEFLSVYETERLIQRLLKMNIDTHNMIVNQVLFPDRTVDQKISCNKCNSRYKIQQKYLKQIEDLYDDFHITKLPLLEEEVRGSDSILEFSQLMLEPEY